MSEIRVLKVRLADLRRQLHVLRAGAANVDVLKREVAGLGRQLLGERTKVRALSEELETPLNVHRWAARSGGGSDGGRKGCCCLGARRVGKGPAGRSVGAHSRGRAGEAWQREGARLLVHRCRRRLRGGPPVSGCMAACVGEVCMRPWHPGAPPSWRQVAQA